MKLSAVGVVLICFLPARCFAQQVDNEIVINVKEHTTTAPVASLTTPVICPVVGDCADTRPAKQRKPAKVKSGTALRNCITSP